MKRNIRKKQQQNGFTIMQMVVTIAIIAIVSTFGVLGIRTARAEFRLQSSARLFASYVEKARADSVRRHAADGNESSVESGPAGSSSYSVKMDFGTGTVETRNFQLDPGIEFSADALKVTFDWRGRLTVPCAVTKSCVFQIYSPFVKHAIPVDVSGSGDITVDAQHFPDGLIPDVEIADVGNDISPEPAATPPIEASPNPDGTDPVDSTPTPTATPTATPTPTPNGNGNGYGSDNGNSGNGNGNASPTPTPVASPSPGIGEACVASISPSEIRISQSDQTNQTGTATFTMVGGSGARIISAAQDGNGNSLVIALSLVRIDGSGSSQISVTSKHGAGNRGAFSVKVSAAPTCGSTQTLKVIVDN